MPDDPSSALDQIRGLIAERDTLLAATDWSGVSLSGFNAAQDKLAARVPSLVAAIKEVLKLADDWDTDAKKLEGRSEFLFERGDETAAVMLDGRSQARKDGARQLREAITAALAGSQLGEGESSDGPS